MTFKQAFTQWASVPEHTALAASSRTAVTKVITEHYGDVDVRLFDKSYVEQLFTNCKQIKKYRVNAASVLCNILSWLHQREPSVYPEPEFNLSINSSGRPEEQHKQNATDSSAKKPVKQEKPSSTKKEYSRKGRAVVQISIEDLKEVNRFPSTNAVKKALGFTNVSRAAAAHGISNGFYWAYEDEWNDEWKPLTYPAGREVNWIKTPAVAMTPAQSEEKRQNEITKVMTVKDILGAISDEELLNEISRRDNWHGTISFTKSITK